MWAPHPRGRIIRRPQPDFSHRRSRIQRKPAPQVTLDSVPDPRCNYKYFGIHRSDITDHLKIIVPSHAFHPSLVGAGPPAVRGRGPHSVKQKRRPETAPASTVWFGRTCSDVSDWLRYRPPAHLGLDPDNKPLPSYPTSSSLVTDPKWQTKEFPALPNVLWHWWKERPSSVPLATNPHQVKFGTLVEALKNRVVKPSGPYTPPASAPVSVAPSPRSEVQTPRNIVPTFNGDAHQSSAQTPRLQGAQTPRNVVSTSNGETHQSRAQAPQLQASKDQLDPKSLEEFPSRPASVSSSTFVSRPCSAPNGMTMNHPTSTPRGKNGPIEGSGMRPSSTPRHHSVGESSRPQNPPGSHGCERPGENLRDTPKSDYGGRGVGMAAPFDVRTHQVALQKCACDRSSQSKVTIPSINSAPFDVSTHQVALQKCACDRSSPSKVTIPRINSGVPFDVRTHQIALQKCACDHSSLSKVTIPRINLQDSAGETSVSPNKISTPTVSSGKPPPSPRPLHPNPPHIPRQAIPHKTCGRHHTSTPPSGLYVQGQGQGSSNRVLERKALRAEAVRASQAFTLEDMKKMSPDSFATKIVWAEKLKTQGQGLPWPFEEKKAVKSVKVF